MNQADPSGRRSSAGAMQRREPTAIDRLFDDSSRFTYAVLDGARVDKLVRQIGTLGAASACLFAGKLDPSRARIAPYLVQLEREGEFARWLFERGIGRSWGVFLRSDAPLDAVRKHLRRFLLVQGPDGRQLYFRWYDPRVLRVYLPTCNATECATVFGPLRAMVAESEDATQLLFFAPDSVPPEAIAVPIGTATDQPS